MRGLCTLRSLARGALFALVAGAALSCSIVLDATAEQCATTADCVAKGGAFVDTVCSAEKTCVFACRHNKTCIDRNGGKPAICHFDDGSCVALESQDCTTLLMEPKDLEDDGAVVLGILLPQTGVNAPSMVSRVNAIELARRQLESAANGLPPKTAGGPPRPLVFLSCTDADDATRAARHLAEVVRVPAIVGPAFSGVTTRVARDVTIPAGVLVISPSATSPTLTELPDNGLVWRTAPSDVLQSSAMAQLVEKTIEPEVRSFYKLLDTDRIRLAVVHKGDTYGKGLAEALFKSIKFNGASAAANADSYKQIDYGDPQALSADDLAKRTAAAVDAILAFKPHVLVTIGTAEGVKDIFKPLETKWPTGEAVRPRHIVADGMQIPELVTAIGSNDALRRRVFGTIAGTTGGNFDVFRNEYRVAFGDKTSPDSYAAGAYDAAYLLAYAIAAAGNKPLDGAVINEGLKKTVPKTGAVAVNVGLSDVNKAYKAMPGPGIDFNGASGPLDFDVSTGEAAADIQIWCVSGAAFRNTGLFLSARSRVLEGTIACP